MEEHIKNTRPPTVVKKQGIEQRLIASLEKKESGLKLQRDKKKERELDGCTFQPNSLKMRNKKEVRESVKILIERDLYKHREKLQNRSEIEYEIKQMNGVFKPSVRNNSQKLIKSSINMSPRSPPKNQQDNLSFRNSSTGSKENLRVSAIELSPSRDISQFDSQQKKRRPLFILDICIGGKEKQVSAFEVFSDTTDEVVDQFAKEHGLSDAKTKKLLSVVQKNLQIYKEKAKDKYGVSEFSIVQEDVNAEAFSDKDL